MDKSVKMGKIEPFLKGTQLVVLSIVNQCISRANEVCVCCGEWGLKLAQGVILQPVALIDCIDARVARMEDEEVEKEAAILQTRWV
jgi:hypothetical protein